ncbi:hypothetical protein [Levilactobacillus angrenensis]|uniref:Uncharacterized protein n=1 Tax=Levilactobacillus angrenensis TaxID=2486020 RepID=A0ABW1UCV3_9LACO|nr:hypothetical protein [Levilactobacillus angrenensis]
MLNRKVWMTFAVAALSLGAGVFLTQPQPVVAQGVTAQIPQAYRGHWRLAHCNWYLAKGTKLTIGARSFKSKFGTYQGDQLGVDIAPQAIGVFQAANGMQVSPENTLQLTHYQQHVALKWTYNTGVAYYIK